MSLILLFQKITCSHSFPKWEWNDKSDRQGKPKKKENYKEIENK